VDLYVELPYIMIMVTPAKRSPAREHKTQRLELRVTLSARRVIEQAIAVSGLAAGDLAYEGARQILSDHDRMDLVGADREVFLNAVAKPPRPAARQESALPAHGKLRG